MTQGPSDTILVAIRITLRIRESKVQNSDSPDRRRFVLSECISCSIQVISGVCDFVFVCPVRGLKRKRLELSTPNLVHLYSMTVAPHALTRRSKGQRSRSLGYGNRHGRMAASGCCGRCATAVGVGLHVV